jgi:hypothetical protein
VKCLSSPPGPKLKERLSHVKISQENKTGEEWSPNAPFTFKALITSKGNPQHRVWASSLGLKYTAKADKRIVEN